MHMFRPPPRIPYQPPLNQPPSNPSETLTSDEIYSIIKALTSTPLNKQNDDRQEIAETIPPNNEPNMFSNAINCFLELRMAEEEHEEDTEDVFDLQHSYNTRSKGSPPQDTSPMTSA